MPHPAFLDWSELQAVLRALPEARIVGGAVRDALLEHPVSDVDLATPSAPAEVAERLAQAGIRTIPTGLAHGTVTALSGARTFEITTLRRDVATDGRHAVVAFTDDWHEDAARRDFTINALSMTPAGEVSDYFGGLDDLRAGRVRFVGEAARRIAEDYLRILRFFRFQARYGRPPPDAEAAGAIAAAAPNLARLSVERVWSELGLILAGPDAGAAVRLMDELGVLAVLLPEGADLGRFGRMAAQGAPRDAVLLLAGLLPASAHAGRIAERLKLSGAERDRLVAIRTGPVPQPGSDETALRRLLADEEREILIARTWLQDGTREWAEIRRRLGTLPRPRFPLSGKDALDVGLVPGPAVGEVLREVRRWWMDGGCEADFAACRERLSKLVASDLAPFRAFVDETGPQTPLRAAVTAAYRRPEPECLPPLLEAATLPASVTEPARATARHLVTALRGKARGTGVEALLQEFALSSQEGVALMCLAEALLRIPDRATRDALIRDKIGGGDWRAHLGHSPSLFVNAAAWGLLVTGRLTATASETGLSAALTRLIARGGEPLIRTGVDLAMRLLGEQFVMGETIAAALARSRRLEAKGFRYSYDMLGEAAVTAADAARYLRDYEQAIDAIGAASVGRGIYEGPGISIKLSALHPRYARMKRERVMAELLPRLFDLAVRARRHAIGLNIDAEEAERLDLSLDLLEALCHAPELQGWNGVGFVVQAYQKRTFYVLDWLIDLARRTQRRLMLRLVKGAYWDSEIKRAQVDGLADFPVFTRKVHTDVSYLACARKLLAAPDAVFPQFATHNAQTLATIHAMAGDAGYEFQCLHGMGEPLYEEVVGPEKLGRACRIYAPVGTHETLLAYLVRRLLENGANTSFVHRIGDPSVPVEALIADPVAEARAIVPPGSPHPRIALPGDLFGSGRRNSRGLDLTNEATLAELAAVLAANARAELSAAPLLGSGEAAGAAREVRNPADHRDLVGHVIEATPEIVADALAQAEAAAPVWAGLSPSERAARLLCAADLMEARLQAMVGIIVREAGRTLVAAISEVRETVDFLRYYGAQVRDGFDNATHRPLGIVACISPWNFPLSIFTGQVAGALAAGNAVLAKSAEETPLIAAAAVRLLREAGVPAGAVQLLPGGGEVGAALVADPRVGGVMFTGSTEVARLIQAELAKRLGADGKPVPFVAETGGQNALVVDSSALPEQVVIDALTSAFDSAGQRCSALRVLCLQDDVADRMLTMLKGAADELALGPPDRLATDVGPVITAEARDGIAAHIATMRGKGHAVHAVALPEACRHGTFVAPTIIEIDDIAELRREVFGPVLHVVRFRREGLDALLDAVNATGYGLTFGVHSRIDETIARAAGRAAAGNIYVNRNLIGAVVGGQPFGGRGLSGTGPKAGGPLYLRRLLAARPAAPPVPCAIRMNPVLADWQQLLGEHGYTGAAARCARYAARSPLGARLDLPGPAGETNVYSLEPRGTVLCVAASEFGLLVQVGAALATGNRPVVRADAAVLAALPAALRERLVLDGREFDAILVEGASDRLCNLAQQLAADPSPCPLPQGEGELPSGNRPESPLPLWEGVRGRGITPIFALTPEALRAGEDDYPLEFLLDERSVSTNTAAAGGNASLMAIG